MNEETNAFDKLSGFKETLARIARVPLPSDEDFQMEVIQRVRDESNGIVYKLISDHRLSSAEVRAALGKAFRRTEIWPEDEKEIEIQV